MIMIMIDDYDLFFISPLGTEDYNYMEKNTYLMYSYWRDVDHSEEHRVAGECTWLIPEDFGIDNSIEEIGTKITVNDFLFFTEFSHGGVDCEGKGFFSVYNPNYPKEGHSVYYGEGLYYGEGGPLNNPGLSVILREHISGRYARNVMIFDCCKSGTALHNLSIKGGIIISSTKPDEDAWCEVDSNYAHSAFLYEGLVWPWETHPGFLKNMGSIEESHSVKYAFKKGYDAATNNRYPWKTYESHPRISNKDMAENTYW